MDISSGKEKDIRGIINFVSKTEDFFKNYTKIENSIIYSYEKMNLSFNYGLILKVSKDSSKAVVVPLSLQSYLTLKRKKDIDTREVQDIYGIFKTLINKKYEILLGFIKKEIDGFFEAYIVFKDNDDVYSVNCRLTDIIMIKDKISFPLYINNKVLKRKQINYNNFIKDIESKI